jgi:nicotinamide riboside kinase
MKIAISGTSSVGKSTLANLISNRTGIPLIREIASTYSKEDRATSAGQKRILSDQINAEIRVPKFISDRSVIDNLAYCLWQTRHGIMTAKEFDDCVRLSARHMRTHSYNLVAFVDEILPLQDNGIRDMDPHQQRDIYYSLRSLLSIYRHEYNFPLICITGSLEQRAAIVVANIYKVPKGTNL